MDILNRGMLFSFLYNGIPAKDCALGAETERTDTGEVRVCRFPEGLKISTEITFHPAHGALEWVNTLENVGETPTGLISELFDCDVTLPLPFEAAPRWTAYRPTPEESTNIYVPAGSNLCADEFNYRRTNPYSFEYESILFTGREKRYAPHGGRSSQGFAPFFNIHKQGSGYFFAVGWTGQWNARFYRTEDAVRIRAGVENTNFRLLPGEKIRTCSGVLLPYTASLADSFNLWRRLVREEFSLVGRPGRDASAPFSAMMWGGMPSEEMIRRVKLIEKYGLPVDTVWVDAGWYGLSKKPSPDEFEGDWPEHTGDWRVNPYLHPDGLKDVADAVHAAGRKFLLWAEPERVRVTTPVWAEHPAYFFRPLREGEKDRLLNLGDDAARQYCFETLSRLIEDLPLDWYRQDFNFDPLPVWRFNDAPEREGISEIKHINGLYRLWDALLERFPHLMIDNCASGGRRMDIETLRRSVPLWRSDMQCPESCSPAVSQAHCLSFAEWLPFSGTGAGGEGTAYRMRSCYAPGLGVRYAYSEKRAFGDPAAMDVVRERCAEFVRVRPFLSEDAYALTVPGDAPDTWSAQQYHRPHDGAGIVLIFRREDSPYETAAFPLRGLDPERYYVFSDADTGEQKRFSGGELADQGLNVRIGRKEASKLYFYAPEGTRMP